MRMMAAYPTDIRSFTKILHPKKKVLDLALLLFLSSTIFAAVWAGFRLVTPAIIHVSAFDYWFDGDSPDVYNQFLYRLGGDWHWRTSHHPLFSLVSFSTTYLIRKAFHVSPETAVVIIMAIAASLWISSLFILLRALRLKPIDAAVFCILASMSASAIFWFPVPETFSFGALSIMVAVAVVALSERVGHLPLWVYLLISACTLSITTTNWMAGLAMLFALLSWKKALKVAIASLGIVIIAAAIQKALLPHTQFFIKILGPMETFYVFHPFALGAIAKANVFFFHSVIMPEIKEAYNSYMSVQGVLPGAGSLLATIGVIMWVSLLALAVWGFRKYKGSKASMVLVLIIVGQLLLHIVYGKETFLFSLHFAPLLVAFSAMSTLTPARKIALVLATVLAVLAGVNNIQKFVRAADQIEQRYQQEYAFIKHIGELTEPESLIIFGERPFGGWPSIRMGRLHRLGRSQVERKGWGVPFEDWSIKLIENLRRKGAKYFVTNYIYGLEQNLAFTQTMAKRYRLLEPSHTSVEVTSKWVIYRLDKPSKAKPYDSKRSSDLFSIN